MARHGTFSASVVASLILVGGCAEPGGDDQDGDGKADSFGSPTEHGELRFGVPNPAEFTDTENFHSWTFELTDTADISLTTEVSHNLDTVMFLYRRDPGETNYGPNIAKNDDHEGSLGSRIALDDAEPGEYRIKVKAAKILRTGAFSVLGTCDGPGCPVASSGDFEPLPDEGMTESCISSFIQAVSSDIVAEQSPREVQFPDPELGHLDEVEARAVGYYVAYWDDVVGFADIFEPDVIVDVERTRTSEGSVVHVDAPGDESAMTLVFDSNDDLLMLYQHNQSPDSRWYCTSAFEPQISPPDEDCSITSVRSLLHDESDAESGQIDTFLEEIQMTDTDPRIARAVDAYEEDNFVAPDEPFTLFFELWEDGAEISFDGQAISTYYIDGGINDDAALLASFNEEGEGVFICE